jgi:hypothetical protein
MSPGLFAEPLPGLQKTFGQNIAESFAMGDHIGKVFKNLGGTKL